MSRTTSKDLDQCATVINNRLSTDTYYVQYAYGRPRLQQRILPGTGERDVSPRLPAGQLEMWMWAFIAGMEALEKAEATP